MDRGAVEEAGAPGQRVAGLPLLAGRSGGPLERDTSFATSCFVVPSCTVPLPCSPRHSLIVAECSSLSCGGVALESREQGPCAGQSDRYWEVGARAGAWGEAQQEQWVRSEDASAWVVRWGLTYVIPV